ncbi:MAG: Bor family protein [Gemmatimonadales bacterium]
MTAVLLCALFLPGCYHAVVTTGATPSPQVIEKSFASGWIYGLVPPSTVETAAKCPNGVAKVETQLSFVNQLVAFITFEIYTPMTIKVTCAAAKMGTTGTGDAELHASAADGPAAVQQAFKTAADKAVRERRAVLVQVGQ